MPLDSAGALAVNAARPASAVGDVVVLLLGLECADQGDFCRKVIPNFLVIVLRHFESDVS